MKNSERDGNSRPPYLSPEKPVCGGKKQQLEPDMEKLTGSKLGEEYIKPVNRQPYYLTYTKSTSCETLGWMNHKLESKLPGQISTTSDMQIIAL